MSGIELLGAEAALEAAKYFGKKVADGAATSAGAKVVEWLREKFAPGEKAALEQLAKNPNSLGAQRMLEGTVMSRLESDPTLMQELSALLKHAGSSTQTQIVRGNSNESIQVGGNYNTINYRRPGS